MDRKLSMKLIRIKYIENTLSSCLCNRVHILVQTTRQQATHLQWATTTCHKESVSLHPDKMTDPRNVKFMYNKDHAKYNQKYGVK